MQAAHVSSPICSSGRLQLPAGEEGTLPEMLGLSVLIFVQGEAVVEEVVSGAEGVQTDLSAGSIQLICPRTALRIRATTDVLAFRGAAALPPDASE